MKNENDPHNCETIPVGSRSLGAIVQETARRAWSSLRPPALPTVFFDTPKPAEPPPSVGSAAAQSVRKPHAEPAAPAPGRAGWYTAGVLAALLAVVWVRGTAPLFAATPDPFPASPAVAADAPYTQGVAAAAAAPAARPGRVEAPVAAASPAKPTAPLTLAMPASAAAAIAPVAPVAMASAEATSPRAECEEHTAAGRAAVLRGDLPAAQAHFTTALSSNASYFPAALGLADTLWAMGKQSEAASQYQAMIGSYPASMIPARANERTGGPIASR